MYRGRTVAVVVPAYNEAGYVGDVIDKLPSYVDRAYVIDDGSTDETWSEIRRAAARRNRDHEGPFESLVVPIRHEQNRGVGAAIKTGYLRARDERVDVTAVLGGDDQMDPDRLTAFLDPIVDGVAEYAKGDRFGSRNDWRRMPRFRLVGNVMLSYLTKIASGYWDSMDSQNGYTAISLSALERTDIEGLYEYYGYCNDLLVRLNVADVRIVDVPQSADYVYTEDWKSHISYTEYIPRVSIMLLDRFLWRIRTKYLLMGYDPIAGLYLLGSTTLTVGVLGFLASLFGRRGGAGQWFLSSVVGALVFVAATLRDRDRNSDLQVRSLEDATRETERTSVSAGPSKPQRPNEPEEPPQSKLATGRTEVEYDRAS